jgi:hypothetical protein
MIAATPGAREMTIERLEGWGLVNDGLRENRQTQIKVEKTKEGRGNKSRKFINKRSLEGWNSHRTRP